MRAARYYGKEDMRLEEIEEPVCGEGQLKIRPAFVGICGTGKNSISSSSSPFSFVLYLISCLSTQFTPSLNSHPHSPITISPSPKSPTQSKKTKRTNERLK